MAGSFRNRKLFLAYPGAFKRQTAFGVAMANTDIDTRHPQTTPTYPGRTTTREQIRDCSGEYIIREDITSRLSRLRYGFDADAFLIAGWLAMAQGAAAAPSGTRVNEVQTITPVGGPITAGSWNYLLEMEGLVEAVDIPFDATAADIQRLLESLRPIKPGNVSVAGTLATTVVITYQGKLAAYNIPAPVIDDSGLTGGTLSVSTTTPGTSKTAAISRTTLDQTPAISFIVGFIDDTTNPDLYKDVVVNSVTIRGQIRGKVSVELDLLMNADTAEQIGYVVPNCVNINPIYTKDCRISINNVFQAVNVREFTYVYSNNIFSGDDAFPYDDIDVERLEHGDRTSSFNFTVYGSKGDTIYTLADAESVVPSQLLLGPPSGRVIVDMPKLSLRLPDDPITFAGEANRSAMQIQGTPFFDQLTAGTPDNVIYYGPETTTFLAT